MPNPMKLTAERIRAIDEETVYRLKQAGLVDLAKALPQLAAAEALADAMSSEFYDMQRWTMDTPDNVTRLLDTYREACR